MTTPERIRVVIVDDPMMRDGLRALINSLADVEIVAEAADGDAARRETQLTRPDVVVMDLHMPAANGVDATRAIRSVAAGQAIFGPTVARRIVDFFASATHGAPATEPFPELTAREREVLDLIAVGRTNAAIAQHLVIITKLQVADRTEAIIRARRAGLGHTP